MTEFEKRRKEAERWELPIPDGTPSTGIAIGVTKAGKWIFGPMDHPIAKKRKERSDKGKPRKTL